MASSLLASGKVTEETLDVPHPITTKHLIKLSKIFTSYRHHDAGLADAEPSILSCYSRRSS